jgi:hypothetical protein
VVAPLLDENLGFLEAVEDFAVEQLVAQLAVEDSMKGYSQGVPIRYSWWRRSLPR